MAAPPSIGQTVVIVDPTNPAQQAVVDNTGALKTTATFTPSGTQTVAISQATPGTTNAVQLTAGTALAGKVGLDQTTPGTTNAVALAQIGATTVVPGGLAGTLAVGGATATNVAITDNPLNTGAQAVTSENTAATTARKVQFVADKVGKQIVLPYANPENFVSGTTAAMTGTTSTSLLAAPAGSLRNYVTSIVVVNSHATVGTFVTIQDGSGGTALMTLAAAAVQGGTVITLPVPLRQPTAATALFCANVTTGANVIATAVGYTGL